MLTNTDIVALLRDDFEIEASSGFPRLRRIPQTKIIQFLDYIAELNVKEQSTLLDALAQRAAILFNLKPGAFFPQSAAFDRYWKAVTSQGPFTGCYRVSTVRGDIRIAMMSFESLWSQPGGWDYLTEENASRSIELLPELVDHLILLTERIAG